MIINFALWNNPAFGDFGNALRANTNPTIDTLTFLGSSALSSLPQIPVFETFVGIILIFGVIYYAISAFAVGMRSSRPMWQPARSRSAEVP